MTAFTLAVPRPCHRCFRQLHVGDTVVKSPGLMTRASIDNIMVVFCTKCWTAALAEARDLLRRRREQRLEGEGRPVRKRRLA